MDDSDQDAAILRTIVRDLAQLLVELDESQPKSELNALGNELERKGMPNQLDPRRSVEENAEALLYVIENHNLLQSDVPLSQVMKSDPHERGEWALDQIMSNISNEDSS